MVNPILVLIWNCYRSLIMGPQSPELRSLVPWNWRDDSYVVNVVSNFLAYPLPFFDNYRAIAAEFATQETVRNLLVSY
jgi:hypothetical protein